MTTYEGPLVLFFSHHITLPLFPLSMFPILPFYLFYVRKSVSTLRNPLRTLMFLLFVFLHFINAV